MKTSKRMANIYKQVDRLKAYPLNEAVDLLKKNTSVKFDETVELAFTLGVDVKKADQMVRGVVTLPHGTGKKVRILVFAGEAQAKEALDAGADFAGFEEYFSKVKEGWVDYDVVISTPDLMREVGKLGKVLGPKGLMPTPKAGTVTANVKAAVREIKLGKIEYRMDKQANVAVGVGKLSFDVEKIMANATSVVNAVLKSKPMSSKGEYLKGLSIASTMGPGLRLDVKLLTVEKE
jgi:large subunit ribosomal protein L1